MADSHGEDRAARVEVVGGRNRGTSIEMSGEVTIGRAPSNTVVLDDDSVSWQHSRIFRSQGGLLYEDLSSRNGSCIIRRGRCWESTVASTTLELQDGDSILVGHSVLAVTIGTPGIVYDSGATTDDGPGSTMRITASADLARAEEADASLRADREALEALYELERRIHSELDPERLPWLVIQAILDAFPDATSAALATLDPVSHELLDVKSLPAEETYPISASTARKVVTEGRALLFLDAEAELSDVRSIAEPGIRCVMCTPLWSGNDVRGVLQVSSTRGPNRFSPRDLALLLVFANRIAIALLNTDLSAERQRALHFAQLTDYLANELRCAATGLTEWLLPLEEQELGPLSELQVEAAQTARLGAQMVSTLVTSMTDLSQLKDPGLVLDAEPVSLHTVIQVPVRLATARCTLEGRELICTIPPDLPEVHADAFLLRRVILNLLFFAMAWEDSSGPIRLAVDLQTAPPTVSVEWHGDPVPQEYRESIFDPATQAALWKDLGRRSVGIGLAFAKAATEAMGGRIWVDAIETSNAIKMCLPTA